MFFSYSISHRPEKSVAFRQVMVRPAPAKPLWQAWAERTCHYRVAQPVMFRVHDVMSLRTCPRPSEEYGGAVMCAGWYGSMIWPARPTPFTVDVKPVCNAQGNELRRRGVRV